VVGAQFEALSCPRSEFGTPQYEENLIDTPTGFSLSWIYTLASTSVLIVQGYMSAVNGRIPISLTFKLLSLSRVVWLSKWRSERIYP